MEFKFQLVTGSDLVLMRIIGNLVSIHGGSWDLNAAAEVDVGVTQVVGEQLNVSLLHSCRVVDHFVVNGASCCNCGFVGDQKEVEFLLSAALN